MNLPMQVPPVLRRHGAYADSPTDTAILPHQFQIPRRMLGAAIVRDPGQELLSDPRGIERARAICEHRCDMRQEDCEYECRERFDPNSIQYFGCLGRCALMRHYCLC